jgi:hypothetical protein
MRETHGGIGDFTWKHGQRARERAKKSAKDIQLEKVHVGVSFSRSGDRYFYYFLMGSDHERDSLQLLQCRFC